MLIRYHQAEIKRLV